MIDFVQTTEFDYAIMGGPKLFVDMEIQRDGQSILFYDSERRQLDRIYCSWRYEFAPNAETGPTSGKWFEDWTIEWSEAREADRDAIGITKHLVEAFILFLDTRRDPIRKIRGEMHRVSVRVIFL